MQTTETAGHASDLARKAAELGQSLVIVCGGDGTISEAAHGLAGSETALAVIPAGTARVWAKEAGLPRRSLDAVRVAVEGEARRIDLGRANGRHFFMMAGIGLDGRIAEKVPPRLKRHFGAAAYALVAMRETVRYKGTPTTLRLDDEAISVNLLMMIVGNTRNYAGITQLTPYALADDGLLDVCIFQGDGVKGIAYNALRVMYGNHAGKSDVVYGRVKRVELPTDIRLPIQLDGDFWAGDTKTFEVVPAALTMMLPKGMKTASLSRQGSRSV